MKTVVLTKKSSACFDSISYTLSARLPKVAKWENLFVKNGVAFCSNAYTMHWVNVKKSLTDGVYSVVKQNKSTIELQKLTPKQANSFDLFTTNLSEIFPDLSEVQLWLEGDFVNKSKQVMVSEIYTNLSHLAQGQHILFDEFNRAVCFNNSVWVGFVQERSPIIVIGDCGHNALIMPRVMTFKNMCKSQSGMKADRNTFSSLKEQYKF